MTARPTAVDTVVLGAGSAGCVLAARLSEEAGRHVALVEAGPDRSTAAIDGVDFFTVLLDDERVWPELMVRRARVQEPRVYRRGRGLGGSSAVNAMIALPGLRDDYERWPASGAPGWGWDALGPRLADLRAGRTPVDLVDATVDDLSPFERALRDGLEADGLGRVDPWASDADGWFTATWTAQRTESGGLRRWSAADAYVTPARSRPNLHVVAGAGEALVTMDGHRATGVQLADGHRIAAGEVIVAAGAIHSPLVLARAGVDRRDLGAHLRDHAAVAFFVPLAPADGAAFASDLARPPATFLARLSSGERPGDLQLLVLSPAGPWPDMRDTAVVMVSLMQADSEGVARPEGIEQCMLDEPRDRRRLRAGVRRLVDLLHRPGVRAVAPEAYCDDKGTAAGMLAGLDDAALDEWMLANLADYVHAVGTCRMGGADDPGAVVDTACRVIGYDGLRVCDASVFPGLPRANTHVSAVVVAEELAARLSRR